MLATGAGVQGLALQPGTHHPPAMDGEGTEVGESLVNIGDSHGARILPLSPKRWQTRRALYVTQGASTLMASAEVMRMTTSWLR
ncbi:hypothetical protein D9M68_453160 [compost metagenome]